MSTIKLAGNHDWLNFSTRYPIKLGKRLYFSSEHMFQALKGRMPSDHEYIRMAANPREAKSRGREVQLRNDWEEVKFALMVAVMILKFSRYRILRKDLMESDGKQIVEARRDPIWGSGADGKGMNLTGQALMVTRAILIASKEIGNAQTDL